MPRPASAIFALLLTLFSPASFGEERIRVEAMNYPAWIIRNYDSLPLYPGFELKANDLLRTGEGGRLLLQLPDSSSIEIGESARFLIESARLGPRDGKAVFESDLQLLRGSFRLTRTYFGASTRGQRLRIRVGAIDARPRDADIWGRSDPGRDMLCLVEGKVELGVAGETDRSLNEALALFVKPRDAAPLPLERVDRERFRQWAGETELDREAGIAIEGGAWQLVLISLSNRKRAEQEMNRYREQGFAVRRKSVIREGRTLHRLLLPGFVSVEAASKARFAVESALGVTGTWVWKAETGS